MFFPDAAQLVAIQEHYDCGRYVTAYRLAEQLAPLDEWRGPRGRILASRLSRALAAPRRGDGYAWLGFRESPDDPNAFHYAIYTYEHRFGPHSAWQFLKRHEGRIRRQTDDEIADQHLIRCLLASQLRDFVAAERHLKAAWPMPGERPWRYVVASYLRSAQGDHQGALELTQECLRSHPLSCQAVHAAVAELSLLGRSEEAVDLLERTMEQVESPLLAQVLAIFHYDMEKHEESLAVLAQMERQCPRLERQTHNWLRQSASSSLYRLGRYDEAVEQLSQIQLRAGERRERQRLEQMIASIRESGSSSRYCRLHVPFIHQQYDTCAPTTLAMVCRFWGREVDHRDIAAEICYGGTPGYRHRQWVRDHGWHEREFCLTEAAAASLIDRGLPFTITTTDADAGHVMAVVGYDRCLRTLLIRDPRQPAVAEYNIDQLLKHYAAFGPTCMVFCPPEESYRLEGLELPESELYDFMFELSVALDRHDRARAGELLESLRQAAPGHRLPLLAEYAVSNYDRDGVRRLKAIEGLLSKYPENVALALLKVQCLYDLARPSVRRELLEQLAGREGCHPSVLTLLAGELVGDARWQGRCRTLLRRALRCNSGDAMACSILGDLHWNQGRRDASLEAYWFALCLNDKNENFVRSYFLAARHLKRTEEALSHVRERFERFAAKSSGPAMSLFSAQALLERADLGLADLERAMALRPQDGELALYAAEQFAAYGRFERAEELLARTRGCSPANVELRAAAQVATYRHDQGKAAELWAEVCRRNPQDAEAIAQAARHLAAVESTAAAQAFLERLAAQYPDNLSLLQQIVQWTPEWQPEERLASLDRLLARDGEHLWALHQKVLTLVAARRIDEAEATARQAHPLNPEASEQLWIEALVKDARGETEEARRLLRQSLEKNVEHGPSMAALMGLSPAGAARREALAFVEQQMVRQTLSGGCLIDYWSFASGEFSAETLQASLERVMEARADLWQIYMVLCRQYLQMQQLDAALATAQAGVERFPLLPRMWIELANVHRHRCRQEDEVAAIEKALEVAPGWWDAIRMLLAVHERNNDVAGVESDALRGIACEPLLGEPYAALAEVRIKQGRLSEARELIEKALELESENQWAWSVARQYAERAGEPTFAVAVARRLVERSPGEGAAHARLASLLASPEQMDERLRTLERALELSPRLVWAQTMLLRALIGRGHYEEARRRLESTAWGRQRPTELSVCEIEIFLAEGDVHRATQLADALLAAEPASVEVCLLRARCAEAAGDTEASLEVYRKAYDVDPSNAYLATALADGLAAKDRKKEAAELLRRAVHLVPTYLYPHLALLDLMVEEKNEEALGWLAERLRAHFHPAYALSTEAQAAMIRGQPQAAVQHFEQMLMLSDTEEAVLRVPLAAIAKDKAAAEQVGQLLLREAQRSGGHKSAGPLWIRAFAGEKSYEDVMRAIEHPDVSESRRVEMLTAYCEAYRQDDFPHGGMSSKLVERHERLLRSTNEAWAQAAHALSRDFQDQRLESWTMDWRQRQVGEAWMLLPVADSALYRGDLPLAREACGRALQLPPDYSTPCFEAMMAWFEAGSSGTAEQALRRVAHLSDRNLRVLYQLVRDFAGILATPQKAAPGKRRSAVRRMIGDLDRRWQTWGYPRDTAAVGLYQRTRQMLVGQLPLIERPLRSLQLTLGQWLLLLLVGMLVAVWLLGSVVQCSQPTKSSRPPRQRTPRTPHRYELPVGLMEEGPWGLRR